MPAPVPDYYFSFLSGTYQGGEFPLEQEKVMTIGREPDVEMVIMETGVSRAHAQVSTRGGTVVLKCLGATNGTFVNGERVVGQVQLKVGDKIVIGQSLFRLGAR